MTDATNGSAQAPELERHPLSPEERAVVQAIQRDIEALQNQLRGALRVFLMARGITGPGMLTEDGTVLLEGIPATRL